MQDVVIIKPSGPVDLEAAGPTGWNRALILGIPCGRGSLQPVFIVE